MDSSSIAACRFKLHYMYAIDFASLLNSNADKRRLQELRSKGDIRDIILGLFDNTHAFASTYNTPSLETVAIESNTKEAIRLGGKNIWSKLFFTTQVPILFCSDAADVLSTTMRIRDGSIVKSNNKETGILYEGTKMRLFRDGVLAISFDFAQDAARSTISIDELIVYLGELERETTEGFRSRIKRIMADWHNHGHLVNGAQSLGLSFDEISPEKEDTLATETVKHTCIFLEGLYDTTTNDMIDVAQLSKEKLLLGILNKSSWYGKYGEKYIEKVFRGDVAYRQDEIYVTDKDSTLVLLADYWNVDLPLERYRYDLLLAVQLQLVKLAYINSVLCYLRDDPVSIDALRNPSEESTVDVILQARSIVTYVQEILDINALVSHGFTRRFLAEIAEERHMKDYITSICRRIDDISSAISLKASLDIGQQSFVFNQRSIRWAIWAIIITAFLSAANIVVTTIIGTWN